MRTPTTSWILVLAALPTLGAFGCGDDTTDGTTSSSSSSDGGGGTTGDGGGTTASVTTATSSTTTTTTTASTGGEGGQGGDGGQGGEGGQGGGDPCGNGAIDGDEVCDGAELDGATCEGEGFVSGALACNDTCTGFDTSACETCGDDAVNGDDVCDGTDLAGQDCTDAGFDGGTLGCTDACALDTTQCADFSCGDGVRNGDEACEGADLGGSTCASAGFIDGTISCSPTCQLDTSLCRSCGDDVVNGTDVCDGPDLAGATCTSLGMGFTGGTLSCDETCARDTAGCTTFALPAAGELVINEIMINPSAANDSIDEWVELFNPTGATYQLNGCVLSSNNDAPFTLAGDFTVAPGGFFTLAKTGTTSFTPDAFYPGNFALGNGGDFVTLTCNAIVVDTVDYDADGFVVPTNASLQLDPGIDATGNDLPESWCPALVNVGLSTADLGTPGTANPDCPSDVVIGSCRLQFPASITAEEGTPSELVYGRVFVEDVTDVNLLGNDDSLAITAQVGFGPDASDPDGNVDWTWVDAAPNAQYGVTSAGFSPIEDEYAASFPMPTADGSPRDYAYRFSGDGGDTWTYCDLDGSGDDYEVDQAGVLVSTPTTQTFDLFFSEYIESPTGQGSNKVLEIFNYGAEVDLAACELRLYNDGGATPNNVVDATFPLTGALLPDDVLVVCHASADDVETMPVDLCDVRIAGGVMNYNGNDTIGLWCAGLPIDVVGQIGVNPGASGWGTAPVTTADRILRRSCDVVAGDSDPNDAYTPVGSWVEAAYVEADMDADLGQYVCPM